MGCWNETCGITNTPIFADDPIVLFITCLMPSSVLEGVYPTDGAFPICLPIHGTYNMYGSIENVVKDWNVEVIEKYFGMKISDIFSHIQDDRNKEEPILRVKTSDPFMAGSKLFFWMVHKKVYEACVSHGNIINRFTLPEESLTLAKSCKTIKEEHIKAGNRPPVGDALFLLQESLYLQNPWSKDAITSIYKKVCLLENVSDADFLDFAQRTNELSVLISVMSTARRNFMPTSGSGSQQPHYEEDLEIYNKLNKLSSELILKAKKHL